MSPAKFEELLNIVAPRIAKCSLQREPIGPSERLCCTLRYLVTGDAQSTIAASYRISKTSVCRIVKETTDALWDVLKENFLSKRFDWLSLRSVAEKLNSIQLPQLLVRSPAITRPCPR